jgi:hypothetical protein
MEHFPVEDVKLVVDEERSEDVLLEVILVVPPMPSLRWSVILRDFVKFCLHLLQLNACRLYETKIAITNRFTLIIYPSHEFIFYYLINNFSS